MRDSLKARAERAYLIALATAHPFTPSPAQIGEAFAPLVDDMQDMPDVRAYVHESWDPRHAPSRIAIALLKERR